jgi:hypothetical protein
MEALPSSMHGPSSSKIKLRILKTKEEEEEAKKKGARLKALAYA